jgi:WD40 repeat protein
VEREHGRTHPAGFGRGGIRCLAFSQDGKRLAAGTSDGWSRVWNVEPFEMVGEVLHSDVLHMVDLALSQDETRLAAARGRTIMLWQVDGEEEKIWAARRSSMA